MPSAPSDLASLNDPHAYTWRPLAILGIYRLLIIAAVALVFFSTRGTAILRTAEPGVFQLVLAIYFALALLAYALIRLRRPAFMLQVYFQLGLDIIAITHLILASGTLGNGLAALMVVAIAGCSILVGVRTAAFFAAVASLVLLTTQVLTHLQRGTPSVDYSQIGFLGVTIFVTAMLVSFIARRARQSQALADLRRADIESLQALNAYVVQAMQAGVLAVDGEGRVRMMNQAARRLLGQPPQPHGRPLTEVAPALGEALQDWLERGGPAEPVVIFDDRELALRLRLLGDGDQGALVFIQDSAALRAQIQESKLASIGRLTANIAHEIRNPLGAMMHAAQLLEESEALSDADRRLIEIIRKQGGRLNRVVENVLQLSRQQAANVQTLALAEWLENFARDFQEQYPQQETYRLEVAVDPVWLRADFDPDHLHQILTNLCRNAIQHGRREGRLDITLRARLRPDGRVALEVRDDGAGLAPEAARRLFEPFFTTSRSGTGLGLYLCEELCAANRARLAHVPTKTGTCFQISFGNRLEEAFPA